MSSQAYLRNQPALAPFLEKADHIDVKHATGPAAVSLPALIAGIFTYQPRWVTALYVVRWGFVRLLGMTQEGIPAHHAADPTMVSMVPGETFQFLTVKATDQQTYWVGGADDKHLSFDVIAAVEPLDADRCRFYLMTIVRYNHWTGPIYFNVIKPFHLLIVHLAVHASIRRAAACALSPAQANPAQANQETLR
jgi:hypothetical protein